MKVDVEQVSSFQKQVTIVVPHDDVRKQLDRAYQQLSRKVRLPGFRPGKAPRRVLEARYAAQVESDVAQELIQTGWTDALQRHDLEPVSQPSLEESGAVGDSEGFRFVVTVDVRPEIELSSWTGLEVPIPEVSVEDAEVDQLVASRLESSARLEEVTGRATATGDMALVELTVTDGEDQVAHEPGTMIRTEGDPYYPGVEGLIIGLQTDGEATGEVTFGEDARVEAVAGRTLQAAVKVMSIQTHTVPELTDEVAEELGYEDGVKGMRSTLEDQLRSARDETARNQARANLLEALIEANEFDVPDGMVQQALSMLMGELRSQQARSSGRDPSTIGFSDAQMIDLRIRAAFAAKAGLILDWVADKESIEVTEDDLETRYQELADERGQAIEALRGWFQKQDAVGELRERLLEEKTLDWLLDSSTLVPHAPEAAPEAEEAPKAEKAASKKRKEAPKEAAEAAPAGDADVAVLQGAIGALRDALGTGAHDAHLDALLAAEEADRARKGAISAIKARIKAAAK